MTNQTSSPSLLPYKFETTFPLQLLGHLRFEATFPLEVRGHFRFKGTFLLQVREHFWAETKFRGKRATTHPYFDPRGGENV